MKFHRMLGYAELVGDITVRQPICDELEHRSLARRQCLDHRMAIQRLIRGPPKSAWADQHGIDAIGHAGSSGLDIGEHAVIDDLDRQQSFSAIAQCDSILWRHANREDPKATAHASRVR